MNDSFDFDEDNSTGSIPAGEEQTK